MKATKSARNEDFLKNGPYTREWFCVDATDKTLGRLATEIARVLRGKHKPIFTPHVDTGDYVVVINADKIKLTGKKWSDKMYHHHTGYPGGLKSFQAIKKFERDPTSLLRLAVKGMMTKSALGRETLRKLKVYAGAEHPHAANQPKPLEL